MEELLFHFRQEATLSVLINDVIKSSAIEGETLDYEEVRSSISKKLGMTISENIPVSRDVDGVVEMMLDATQKYDKSLTKERIWDGHASLFPTGPMNVVSGPIALEKIHFEAPSEDRIEPEMTSFLTWFETEPDIDPVLFAGLAHFWFITIHPFEDGNGRIARAIADMALAKSE